MPSVAKALCKTSVLMALGHSAPTVSGMMPEVTADVTPENPESTTATPKAPASVEAKAPASVETPPVTPKAPAPVETAPATPKATGSGPPPAGTVGEGKWNFKLCCRRDREQVVAAEPKGDGESDAPTSTKGKGCCKKREQAVVTETEGGAEKAVASTKSKGWCKKREQADDTETEGGAEKAVASTKCRGWCGKRNPKKAGADKGTTANEAPATASANGLVDQDLTDELSQKNFIRRYGGNFLAAGGYLLNGSRRIAGKTLGGILGTASGTKRFAGNTLGKIVDVAVRYPNSTAATATIVFTVATAGPAMEAYFGNNQTTEELFPFPAYNGTNQTEVLYPVNGTNQTEVLYPVNASEVLAAA
jgi:hypothetical protein